MATMKDMFGQMLDKIADQAGLIGELRTGKAWAEKRATNLEKQLQQEKEHREQTALRNQQLTIEPDEANERLDLALTLLADGYALIGDVWDNSDSKDCYYAKEIAAFGRFCQTYRDLFKPPEQKASA